MRHNLWRCHDMTSYTTCYSFTIGLCVRISNILSRFGGDQLDFSMTITLWSPTYILKVSKFYIEHARFFLKKQFIGWKIIPKVIRYILDWLVDHSAFLKCWLSYMHFLLFSYFCVSNHEPNEKWELPQLDKLCIRFKCIHLVLMIKY